MKLISHGPWGYCTVKIAEFFRVISDHPCDGLAITRLFQILLNLCCKSRVDVICASLYTEV